MSEYRPCVLIPTYDNPRTVRDVVLRVREHLPEVVVVDDGSGPEGREAVATLGRDRLASVTHRDRNGGKGAAVKTGFRFARSLGFTHAIQLDADGQHALDDVPAFLAASRANPNALILGQPRFDESAPIGRRIGRQISIFWARIEAGADVIGDPLCGFRVYPLETAIRANARGDRMDFDPEVAVRIAWTGAPVIKIPTQVRYIPRSQGGVSHFKLWSDNWLISVMHARLTMRRLFSFVFRFPLVPALPPGDAAIALPPGATRNDSP